MPEQEPLSAAVQSAAGKILKPFFQIVVGGTLLICLFFAAYARVAMYTETEPTGFRYTVLQWAAVVLNSGLPFVAMTFGFFGLVFFRSWQKFATFGAMVLLAYLIR